TVRGRRSWAEDVSFSNLLCRIRVVPHRLRYFFFSSRRRHTRSLRDWSSDVCSSDLIGAYNRLVALRNRYQNAYAQIDVQLKRRRSEERRVGKECRSRGSP